MRRQAESLTYWRDRVREQTDGFQVLPRQVEVDHVAVAADQDVGRDFERPRRLPRSLERRSR